MVRIMLVVLVVAMAAVVGGCSPQNAIPAAPSAPAAPATFMSTVKTTENPEGFDKFWGTDSEFSEAFVKAFEREAKMTLSQKQKNFVEQEIAPRIRTIFLERFKAFKAENPKGTDTQIFMDLHTHLECVCNKHALEIAREVLQAN